MFTKHVFLAVLASFIATTAFATEFSCLQNVDGQIFPHMLVVTGGENSEIQLDGFSLLENTTGFKKGCKGTFWLQSTAGFKRYTALLQAPASDMGLSCTVEEDLLIEQTLIDGNQGAIKFIDDQGVGDAIPCTWLN